jgi:hypothetical protein
MHGEGTGSSFSCDILMLRSDFKFKELLLDDFGRETLRYWTCRLLPPRAGSSHAHAFGGFDFGIMFRFLIRISYSHFLFGFLIRVSFSRFLFGLQNVNKTRE